MKTKRLAVVTSLLILIVSFGNASAQFNYRRTLKQSARNTSSQKLLTQQLKASRSGRVLVEVTLDESVPAATIPRLLSGKDVKIEYLIYRWGEHTGWYLPKDGESLEVALNNFNKQHSEFLQQQIIDYSTPSQAAESAGVSPAQLQIQRSRARLAQEFVDQLMEFRSKGLLVSGFAVTGDGNKLSTFIGNFPDNRVIFRTTNTSDEALKTQADSSPDTSPQIASNEPYPNDPWRFSPSKGLIIYNKDSRYFKSDFIFTDVSGFTSTHSAYEHDIVIWSNKDTYVRPGPGAWYSNLPKPYLDTTLSDTYAVFTIGTDSATRIKTNTTYYTQMPVFVIDENGGPSSGSIEPQLGSWAGVYDDGDDPNEQLELNFCKLVGGSGVFSKGDPAYCVFADQTYRIKDYYAGSSASSFNFPFYHLSSATYSWDRNVKAPSISPGSGTYIGSVVTSISCPTSGATIRYTTDGTDPSASSPIYSGPLTLTSSVTLKARAFKSELVDSSVVAASYTVLQKVAKPIINPGTGTYSGSVMAGVSTSTTGAAIRYTIDGSDPTSGSTLYSGPLTFTTSVTLKARAFKSGMIDSDVASATYSISSLQKVSTPSINPGTGTYSGSVTASISTSTTGAAIRYTIDGSDPTSSSTLYSGALTFTTSVTLKARAFKSGMIDSDVASVTYSISQTMKVATPVISPGSGTYFGSVVANLSTTTVGATLRYTTNGTDPTSSSSIYSGPLSFTSSVTLKARAFKSGLIDSDVASVTYVVQSAPALSAACHLEPNPITLGQGATVYAQASGGVSPYRYRINGVDMGSISSLLVMPSQLGTFTVPVVVFDSLNQQATNSCSAQVIAPDPYVTGFNYTPNPAKATQVVSLNIYGGNFTPTTQVWFVGPGCVSPGCQTNAVNVVGTAYIAAQAILNLTGSYTVRIRNGSGSWVNVGTVTVVQ